MPRATALVALLAVSLVPLVACGDDGGASPAAGESSASADNAAAGAPGPVTVEHRYGTTTLDETPQRIVSLDTQWTDVLVALDAPLIAAAEDPTVDGGRFPWQDAMPSSVETIPVGNAIPYEAVAALQPDLVVVSYFATDAATYDLLTEIAPTIPLLGDEEVNAWQDVADVAGDVLGLPDRADALVAEAEQRSADVLAELPGLRGHTYALASYVPGDAIYVVADPDDGASTFFAQLGLEIDPDLLALADGAAGRATLSLERLDELDADLLLLLTNGADPSEIPGYDLLPAVRDGAVAILDVAAVSGFNTPTPLSIPYSLDLIRPALEAAAT
jgi:iron complex transport system substrate-binding protein